MTKYPCGNDIAVNWTLDLGGMSVDLAECSLLFEYYTGLGSKTIPGSEYSIDGNVLSWTFKGEDQVVYGVYGLRLVASSGGEDIVFKKPDAFEIVHGIAAEEEQTLPLSSSVETEQEPATDPEPEQSDAPVYVSSSPIHVEKVPLGSNITVRWRLLTTEEFDFRLEDCTLNLYYAAAGSGFKMATGYTLDTTDGYVLVWNFAAGEQVRYGLYSLLLDVRQGGTKVATLVKDDAFALVHRRGSVFPDRVIDFESVVTTMGGGALYALLDVINDGYSTVYRSDGVTPAQRDDLLVYNGTKWYAIDGSELPYIKGLGRGLSDLEGTALGLSNRIADLEGNVGELWLTAQEFGVRMTDAEGYIGQLTLTAREFEVRMSDAEGNIGQLSLTAQQFAVRMSDAEGNIGQLALTAQQFGVRMSDIEGNVGELALTAEEFGVRMTNAEGSIGQLSLTAEEFAVRMSDTEGNVSLLQQTATSLTSQIQDAQGNISTLQQTATSLTSRIQSAEGSISTIAQTAESIQLQVDNQQGDIAALEVSARAITSRVSDAEGNISILEQTATSLTSQIEDAEGNISTLQQTATQISSRVTSIEGEFGEGGRVTVAESTIVQQAGLIATKVSQTDYDANNQAISTHFSTIEQTASQISTRVAAVESEFGEGGRVTVAESTIVQQAGLIATKVSQTDYDANNQAISTRFSSIEQTAGEISASVTNVSNNLSSYEALTDAVLTNLQDQIDGVVETWYAEGKPTLSNYPVNTWAQADYVNHIGDLYYDKITGKAYRFMLDDEEDPAVYVWVELADEDIAKALGLAGEKRRVFVSTPYAPYDAGDLWVKTREVNGETTREIYRCKRSRAAGETIDLANDWGPADDYAVTVNKANLKILADAIVGEVAAFTYDSEGKISSSSKSNITQTADAIRLSVSNQAIGTALGEGGSINDALLDTGIDITNGDITLTANHIKLQNQSAVSGLELVTIGTGANQRVVINASSLNVAGIFTTSEWTGQNGIRAGILSDAETAAETYANSSAYLTNYVLPVVQQETSGLAVDAEYNYLKTALENRTTALGGLLLTSLIQLGATQSGSSWEVHSGISGEYVATSDTSDPDFVAGHGIAAWYGGAMVDREDLTHYWTAEQIAAWNAMTEEQREVSNLAAKTLFRMDGSGYLANGAISWGAAGDLHLLDNVYIGPQMNQTLASISTFVTLLSTWFKDDTITINGTDYRVLRVNMASDPASTTGFQGVVWNGFLISGGDQIVISGTPGGGGGGGGATTLAGLDDTNITNPQAGQMLAWNGTKWVNTNAPTGSITAVSLAAGATNGTLHLVINGTAQSDVAVTGLGSMAYKSSLAFSEITGTASASQIPSTVAYQSQPNNFVHSTNEWTVIPSEYSGNLWLNYRTVGGTNGSLTNYSMGNGASGYASVTASSFIKNGGTSSQFLKADGSVDSNTYITGITSTMVTTALGYTPANSTSLANYLPLTGGTIKNGNAGTPLTLDTTSGTIGIYFATSATSKAWVGYQPTYGSVIYSQASSKYLGIKDDGTPHYQSNTLWHAGNLTPSNYVLKAGDTMTGDLYIITGDTDKCIQFSYNTSHLAGAAWRIISNGTGTGDTNYLSFQTGGSSSSATTWNNVLRLSMDNRYVGINMDAPAYQLDVNGTARVTSLKIGSATITWNSNGYLHIDQPLVTAGDQIVISGTPGGGGGGGATTLAGLDDVTITSVANGQLLQYDGSKWVNVAASSVGRIYSAGTGISISASNAISLASGVCTAGTYYKTTVDTYGRVTAGYYADLSAAINGDLGIGSSNPQDADYYIAQYAGGGTTTTSYHRRPHSALYSYINTKLAAAHAGLDKVGTVTKVSTGTGLTGGDITSTGTISINSTYQTYITNGNTAHGWGNHASAGYVKLNPGASEQTLQSSISTLSKGVINLWRSSGDHYTFLGFSNGTTETLLGGIGFKSQSDANLYRRNSSGAVYKIWDEENLTKSVITNLIGTTTYAPYNSAGYLPLSGGSSYPMTGQLYVQTGTGISDATGNGLLVYHPTNWTGVTNTQWGIGAIDCQGVIRSSATDLIHYKGGTNYTIWDSGNSNKSDVSWTCSTLTASGNIRVITTGAQTAIRIGQDGAVNDAAGDILFQNGAVDRNGFKISSEMDSYAAMQRLVFYSSANGTSPYTATWKEAMRISSAGHVSIGTTSDNSNLTVNGDINASGNVGIGTTSPSYKLDVAGQSAAYGFTTRYDLQTRMSSAGWYTVFTALNTNATSQTVILQIRRNYTNSNNETYTVSVNVAYNGKVSFTQISGCANEQLVDKIRVDYVNSGTTTIAIHYTGTVANTVFISGIGDGTFCAPTAVSSVNGTAVEFALQPFGISTDSGITIANANSLGGLDSSGVRRTLLGLENTTTYLAWGAAGAGYDTHLSGNNILFRYGTSHTTSLSIGSSGTVRFNIPNYTDFQILRTNSAGSVAITYYAGNQTTNYWCAGADPATYSDTSLNNRFFWYYNGAYKAYITNTGSFVTIGDQVVSSDLTLKTNLTPVTYSVSDIAKARAVEFDWKDGRGHSMGSIAQDWLGIAPALVHGKEGSMSLAYGQLALVNTILLARQSESHEERIKELEARVAELEMENERLRMN